MSSLTIIERHVLERCLRMASGYVLGFSNSSFASVIAEAVGVDIHDDAYSRNGSSKANKLRTFWEIEPDDRVACVIEALLDYEAATQREPSPEEAVLVEKARAIAARLRSGGPRLSRLKEHARVMDARHLAEQIQRMESAVDSDPRLAIGTAKELIETCCRTILAERGETISEPADVQDLTKATFKALRLVAAGVPDERKGADIIKRLLNNLATVGLGLAELRNLYGTGHGKHGKAGGLASRHAKLAVGAAATLATFLFETHTETKDR